MMFENRTEAGKLLAEKLLAYKGKDVVVYALPRGGVITAVEIANVLHAPLDLVIIRKIGHPLEPEYAIAAISEDGHLLEMPQETASVDPTWFKKEMEKERVEASRRRKTYLAGRKRISATGKIAIIVDDGVATGLTMQLAMQEVQQQSPKKIIIATPVISESIADRLKKQGVELVALTIPSDAEFLGAVGSYYHEFNQVEDDEVIAALSKI